MRTLLLLCGLFTTKSFSIDSLNTKLYEYAKKIPPEHYNQIADLSKYLSIPAKTDAERVEKFASRAFLFVEKNLNKSRTGCAKLTKELKPSHKTKTRAKKI